MSRSSDQQSFGDVLVKNTSQELWNLDAVEWLRSIPDAGIDLAITDPAYESLEKHRAVGTTTRLKHSDGSSNDWFQIFPNSRFPEFFAEMYRVLKPNSHFYMFCDCETSYIAKPVAEAAGFKFWKNLIWSKAPGIGMGYHYRAQYEFILFFEKGKRKLNNLGIPDIITHPIVRKGYPTEKPKQVADVLIRQSSQPGELVIDPFMGSGSTGVAAIEAGRRFWGNDLSPKSIELATQRLAAAKAGKPMVELPSDFNPEPDNEDENEFPPRELPDGDEWA